MLENDDVNRDLTKCYERLFVAFVKALSTGILIYVENKTWRTFFNIVSAVATPAVFVFHFENLVSCAGLENEWSRMAPPIAAWRSV